MYSTCLYCTRDLGANDVLETLPIGRRVAFDAAQGRLWVVCRACAKWNLVPFDTRLETIDACERLFRDTRTRFSTDNIGLARVGEGLELVRIGPALRPEYAAWRYGDRFASRRRRNIVVGTGVAIGGVAAVIGLQALVGSMVGMQFFFQGFGGAFRRHRIATRIVPDSGGPPFTLTLHDVRQSRLVHVEGPAAWGVTVPARFEGHKRWTWPADVDDRVLLTGPDAVLGLGKLLPVLAGMSGSREQVRRAVGIVEQHQTLDALVGRSMTYWSEYRMGLGPVSKIATEPRLALEMLANEDAERRWLEGELKLLEHQWREADQLAAIADALAVPESVDEQLDKLRD